MASVAMIAAFGVSLSVRVSLSPEDACIRYAYGEREEDNTLIMASVEASLADFFSQETPAESSLIEMFKR